MAWSELGTVRERRKGGLNMKPEKSSTETIGEGYQSFESDFQVESADQRFRDLARVWKFETRFISNSTRKAMHSAYQRIIGMGQGAVPLILRDFVENGPNDWFWALTAITDANPISQEIAGNMAAMTEAWLQWGRKKGYLKD